MLKQCYHEDMSQEEIQQDKYLYDCYIEDKIREVCMKLNPRKYKDIDEDYAKEYNQEYL